MLYKDLSYIVIGCCMNIHTKLGPGFLEKIYKRALKVELRKNNIKVEMEYPTKVKWKGVTLGKQKLDLLVDNKIILELKARRELKDIHKQQILSYLKSSSKKLGLVINFGAEELEFERVINTNN